MAEASMINTDWLAAVALFANIVLVGVVIFQYRNTIKHHKSINRPWLVFGGGDEVVGELLLNFHVENIGNLPAEKIEIETEVFYHDSIDKFTKKSPAKPIKCGIIMPKQKYYTIIEGMEVDELYGFKWAKLQVSIKYNFGDDKKMSKFELFYDAHSKDKCVTKCLEAD